MKTPVPKYSFWEAFNTIALVATKALEEVRKLARLPGPPGRDGLGFDDMELVQTDERGFTVRFRRGQEMKEYTVSFPVMIYQGTWREGQRFQRGDVVTWAGSTWHCDDPKGLKPDSTDSGWKLIVKRGRDGKDAAK